MRCNKELGEELEGKGPVKREELPPHLKKLSKADITDQVASHVRLDPARVQRDADDPIGYQVSSKAPGDHIQCRLEGEKKSDEEPATEALRV